ncbi:L-seryl-tRNA selenium transferase [Campylobacter pinnipediorum]|uniref:L-seryl-tRNA selenium transferase n=1 Tax=Campylobacter pinnipediorum TaxID=1965231 RepID=UPI00084E07A4|nr:L-seryl-tRNA selenium transferase [Campylobacter pinnipediorum]AQW81978.1 putative lipoprotein, putative beta-barrel assembly machinery complex lipoprotein BamB [Campylobacter pinnipediorum subsp. pinnipediorum]
MKKILILASISIVLIISGCSTKRQYFEPEKVDMNAKFDSSLDSKIIHTSISGATLENGEIITIDGINKNIKLPKGFKLLGVDNNNVIASDIYGELKVINKKDNSDVFSKKFPEAIVSAAIENNLLAAVSAANSIYLIDIYSAKTIMEYKSEDVFAIDSRVAQPLFLNSIIIYPSLDGKIYVTQKNGQIIKDIVISSESFFNNIIYLDVIDDYMIAATAKKIMVITPGQTVFLNKEIKNILRNEKDIYIFEKDGKITKTDLTLTKLADTYFKFAIFSNATVVNDKLYIVEKTGYIFQTDLNLKNQNIIKINSEIQDKIFVAKDILYHDKEYMKFK